VLAGDSYGDLFAAPSPVLHFWSLSIEEQFYVAFPLLLVGAWALARGRRGPVAAVLGVVAVAAALEPWLFDMSVDRVYFGTDTRAPELLAGSLLAIALSHRRLRLRLVRRPRWRRTAGWVGLAALAVQLWWWWSLPQSTSWLYRGGFVLYAALTCAVLVAATLPRSPLVTALSVAPLRWLGHRSYGIYLFHWPLFLTARQLWPEVSRPVTTAAVVAASLLLAELSLRLVETPVRLGRWPRPRVAWRLGLASTVAIALLAFVPWPGGDDSRRTDFDAALEAFDRLGGGSPASSVPPTSSPAPGARDGSEASGADGTAASAPAAPRQPPVVGVFGDSTALAVGVGYEAWLRRTGSPTRLVGNAELGCGVSRFERRRDDQLVELSPLCAAWPERFGRIVDADRPDVVILNSSVWETADAQLPGDGTWRALGDPRVDDFVRREFLEAVDLLGRHGALVLLMTWPEHGTWADDGRPDAVSRQYDPARMRRLHELYREVVEQRPGQVELLDFSAWLGDRAQERRWRTDGTHFDLDVPDGVDAFGDLAGGWLGEEIDRRWQARAAAEVAGG
jgi:hypothetical protein